MLSVGCPQGVAWGGQSPLTTERRETPGVWGFMEAVGPGALAGLLADTCHPADRRPQLLQRRNIEPSSHQTV